MLTRTYPGGEARKNRPSVATSCRSAVKAKLCGPGEPKTTATVSSVAPIARPVITLVRR